MLPSLTGTEAQRYGFLLPPILYLSSFGGGEGLSPGCQPARLVHQAVRLEFWQGHSLPEEATPQMLVNKAEILLPKVTVSSNLAY